MRKWHHFSKVFLRRGREAILLLSHYIHISVITAPRWSNHTHRLRYLSPLLAELLGN